MRRSALTSSTGIGIDIDIDIGGSIKEAGFRGDDKSRHAHDLILWNGRPLLSPDPGLSGNIARMSTLAVIPPAPATTGTFLEIDR